jgi:hypothetical protein
MIKTAGIRNQGSGLWGQKSLVKFALLLFFEKFNRASRNQRSAVKTQPVIFNTFFIIPYQEHKFAKHTRCQVPGVRFQGSGARGEKVRKKLRFITSCPISLPFF